MIQTRFCAALVSVGLLVAAAGAPHAQMPTRNASKYGATFYWWYQELPRPTLYPPTIEWDARKQAWWNAIVRQASDAGLGWLAPGCWGEGSPADPAMLEPLLRAIDANGGRLKIAMFDDTTSEVLRKNQSKYDQWELSPRFDLADLAGDGEGGLKYFYEQQWKRFFATVPDRYRLKINGRPVIFMWHGGAEWYTNQQAFHTMIEAARAAAGRDFGVDPFVIVEESWRRLDPVFRPDAMYDWFEPGKTFATLTEFGGVHVGHLVPGYDCRPCAIPPGPYIDRQDGELFRAGMDAIAPKSDLILIEGFDNVDENAHLVETITWGRFYINLLRWYATNIP